jgi:protein-S-isoprenylcysteine O-methyltransferase Ste14
MDALEIKGILALSAAWIGYSVIHSLLASLAVKRWVADRWPQLMPLYRILFNLQALVLLVPPLWLTYSLRGPLLWQWTGVAWWLANGLAILALGGAFWSLRTYDGSEFLGLRQWREGERSVEDQESFHLSDLHRYVRHPWYCLGLVLVWTRDMDPAFLLTAILITLYFFIGARLEEVKLLIYHGEPYRHYRKLVPMLFPLPWRFLTREQARKIETSGDQGF